MISLAEIAILEEAHEYGAASLGTALQCLEERWKNGLKDDETFIRLLFLRWYALEEPNWSTGLPDVKIGEVESLIAEKGSVENFCAELKFILGILSATSPHYMGDEKQWKRRSMTLLDSAVQMESFSSVFCNWKYLMRFEEESTGLRKNMATELKARFYRRGYMGAYLISVLGDRVGL